MPTAEFHDAIGEGLTKMFGSNDSDVRYLAASALGDLAKNGELYPNMIAT
jgi:hypothetical protein